LGDAMRSVRGTGDGVLRPPPHGLRCLDRVREGPDYPIWTGGWWGSLAEVPPNSIVPVPYKKLIIKTEGGTSLILDDTPVTGGIFLETSSGQKLTLNSLACEIDAGSAAQGITISASPAKIALGPAGAVEVSGGPSVKVSGAQVDINNGALTVI
jgi:hypothetical protein